MPGKNLNQNSVDELLHAEEAEQTGDAFALPRIDVADYLDRTRSKNTSGRVTSFDSLRGLEDKKRRYVALASELFGLTEAEAEREYDQRITGQFAAAAASPALVAGSKSAPPLTIPPGDVPRYEGKAKSGEIYAFLRQVYSHENGGTEPLTLSYLRKNDLVALTAFRNRQRSEPAPPELAILTDPLRGTRMPGIIEKYGVDLITDDGRAEASRLMGAIGKNLYGPR